MGLMDYLVPEQPLASQPVDAAGGKPGTYGQQVMDLFKFGLSAAVADKAQTNQLDYQKFETTNGQLHAQGLPANTAVPTTAPAKGMTTTTMIMLGGGALLLGFIIWKVAK